jgi:rfaE bifunctional protein nucleotidyltransferase chain/domain
MSASNKIVSFEAAPALFKALCARGKTIVQSHGLFDLIHPGHILHLEEARALGDVLVVTLTADRYVNKGPGRPHFKEQLRLRSLAALSCVDYVVLVPFPGAAEAIACVRPQIYCKGKEYADPDFDLEGNLPLESGVVKRYGGQVRLIGSVKYSSTKLLNQHFDHLGAPVKSFCETLAARYTRKRFYDSVASLAGLRVLVIGDTIFDRYSSVKVQGLTSKNKIISGRFLSEETQTGGALAVFRHVKQLVKSVKFISLTGAEAWAQRQIRAYVAPGEDCVIRDADFTTIIKQRFVEPLLGDGELSKLFSINFIDAQPPAAAVQKKILAAIRREIKRADVVLLLDFGHGMMQTPVRELVQEYSPFLALNCQTNSNNHGFNIISRQYRRADAFTLDEQEMMLSVGQRDLDFAGELARLKRSFRSQYAWLTRGAVQTIGLRDGGTACFCPPLETDVVDTIGAGDAFFSVAALAAARGLPIDLATFLGQLAGAQAVKIVGNAEPISKATLLKSGISLLNF